MTEVKLQDINLKAFTGGQFIRTFHGQLQGNIREIELIKPKREGGPFQIDIEYDWIFAHGDGTRRVQHQPGLISALLSQNTTVTHEVDQSVRIPMVGNGELLLLPIEHIREIDPSNQPNRSAA